MRDSKSFTHVPRAPGKAGGGDQKAAGQRVPLRSRHSSQHAILRYQLFYLHAKPPGFFSKQGGSLLMSVILGKDSVPQIVFLPAAHQLYNGPAPLPQGGGHTVAGGIPSSNNHYVSPFCRGDKRRLAELLPLYGSFQELRSIANPADSLCLQSQRTGLLRAAT
jgi:hypothetical protein